MSDAIDVELLEEAPIEVELLPEGGDTPPTPAPLPREVRGDTTATHTYIGTAPNGTAESESGWTLTRILLASPLNPPHASDSWDNHVSATYT